MPESLTWPLGCIPHGAPAHICHWPGVTIESCVLPKKSRRHILMVEGSSESSKGMERIGPLHSPQYTTKADNCKRRIHYQLGEKKWRIHGSMDARTGGIINSRNRKFHGSNCTSKKKSPGHFTSEKFGLVDILRGLQPQAACLLEFSHFFDFFQLLAFWFPAWLITGVFLADLYLSDNFAVIVPQSF